MNNLDTMIGFTKAYFDLLPQFISKEACFEYLNAEVMYITREKPFKDISSFHASLYD